MIVCMFPLDNWMNPFHFCFPRQHDDEASCFLARRRQSERSGLTESQRLALLPTSSCQGASRARERPEKNLHWSHEVDAWVVMRRFIGCALPASSPLAPVLTNLSVRQPDEGHWSPTVTVRTSHSALNDNHKDTHITAACCTGAEPQWIYGWTTPS